jgi:putative NADH-flavin reductase
MKLVIFGSNGSTGLALVQQALQRGHDVVAFARQPEDLKISHPHLRTFKGDVLDLAAVRAAVAGTDAAISALGVRMGQAQSTTRSQGTSNIVQALTEAGVRNFVSVSTVGAGAHLQTLPWIARFLLPKIVGAWRLEEAGRQEDIVRASKLDWTILRPPRLVDAPVTGRYQIGTTLASGFGAKISRADLATALLDQIGTWKFVRATPTVMG